MLLEKYEAALANTQDDWKKWNIIQIWVDLSSYYVTV